MKLELGNHPQVYRPVHSPKRRFTWFTNQPTPRNCDTMALALPHFPWKSYPLKSMIFPSEAPFCLGMSQPIWWHRRVFIYCWWDPIKHPIISPLYHHYCQSPFWMVKHLPWSIRYSFLKCLMGKHLHLCSRNHHVSWINAWFFLGKLSTIQDGMRPLHFAAQAASQEAGPGGQNGDPGDMPMFDG